MKIATRLTLLALFTAPISALPAQGRAITPDDFITWKSIGGSDLSRDGKWVVYTVRPAMGEGELIARSTTGTTEYRYGRGYIARPSRAVLAWGGGGGGPVYITGDSRWVLFTIDPPMDSVENARREKWPADKQAKSSLGIMDLTTGQVERIARVSAFKIPKDRGSFVAYTLDLTPPKPDTTKKDTAKTPDSAAKKKTKSDGSPVVLRDLATGKEVRLENVTSYAFTDSGTVLVYAVSTKNGSERDGVYVKSLASGIDAQPTTLASGTGHYQSVTIDKAGKQVAFLTDKAEYTSEKPRFALYYGTLDGTPAREVVGSGAVPSGMKLAENGGISFNKGGQMLTFSIGPIPPDTIAQDIINEGAVFDLWHYKDPFLRTQALKEPDYFVNPRYQAVYWPSNNKWLRIGNDTTREVSFSEDGKTAVAISIAPYTIQSMWGEHLYDVYLVNPSEGGWKLVRRGLPNTGSYAPSASGMIYTSDVSLSPGGKYVMLFENKNWKAYNVATGKTVNLTSGIVGVRFDNEEDDHPMLASAHGIAGWTKNDDRVYINDRWDVWEIDPTGVAAPRRLTTGIGRKQRIRFRIHRMDYEDPYIDTSKPVWLNASSYDTKDSGIWEVDFKPGSTPKKLVMVAKSFSVMEKAKDADMYIVTQTTVREYPELWVGPSITSLTKITNLGEQQSQFRWGTASLVRFRNREGVPLQGILYKPDGFDPKKKYPMIVDIYEKLADGLHQYPAPGPEGAAAVNVSVALSRGYVVLHPDIVYRNGHPGMSAVSAVTRAVQSIIDSGFVDPKRIGLVGHSWGGYQDAFIATKTNMFRAIVSGAPVANMTSAYGGIRWGSGLNRSWQYEHNQSRIGATPWDRPDLYLENSTLFHVQNIKTPIMIMHNDNDGAVPWYQGIELYIALRRLGKEAYFFNYNADEHGTTKYANTLDWDTRQMEFLDYYLLGAPKPEWMEKGIPLSMKGREQVPIVKKALQKSSK
jgi:dipeptidyl aminopeptidase/acylaminoacyl peptidase